MQEVAVSNYRAFISAADALLAVRQEVSSIDKHLTSMVVLSALLLYIGYIICFSNWIVISTNFHVIHDFSV